MRSIVLYVPCLALAACAVSADGTPDTEALPGESAVTVSATANTTVRAAKPERPPVALDLGPEIPLPSYDATPVPRSKDMKAECDKQLAATTFYAILMKAAAEVQHCVDPQVGNLYLDFLAQYNKAWKTCDVADPTGDWWIDLVHLSGSVAENMKTCMNPEYVAIRCPVGGTVDITSEASILGVTCTSYSVHSTLRVCKSPVDTVLCQADFGKASIYVSGTSLACNKKASIKVVNCQLEANL